MPTGFEVLRSAGCEADLEAIFDHLVQSYTALGDPIDNAVDRASARVLGIEDAMAALGDLPYQGTQVAHLLPGLRRVTKDSAVFYFLIDEPAQVLRVLGVFFGGQDHTRHILSRLAQDG